jgi:hypothetical protein
MTSARTDASCFHPFFGISQALERLRFRSRRTARESAPVLAPERDKGLRNMMRLPDFGKALDF